MYLTGVKKYLEYKNEVKMLFCQPKLLNLEKRSLIENICLCECWEKFEQNDFKFAKVSKR